MFCPLALVFAAITGSLPAPMDLDSGKPYVFRFEERGPTARGTLTSGSTSCNVDIHGMSSAWRAHTNVFCAKSTDGGKYRESFHIDGWEFGGDLEFKNVEILPVKPVYRKLDCGIELGHGESITGNEYIFSALTYSDARNASRAVYEHRTNFNTHRWCFSNGSYETFRHEIAGRKFLKGVVVAGCGHHTAGPLFIEVSSDNKTWKRIYSSEVCFSERIDLPAEIFPAKEVFVRFIGGEKCDAQIFDYSFLATIDGAPVNAYGATDYVSTKTGGAVLAKVEMSSIGRDDYGALVPGGDADVSFWTASSGWKVPKGRALPTAEAKGVAIRTAANEAESVQLVLSAAKDFADVKVVANDLKSKHGRTLKASAVDIFRVGYVPIESVSDTEGAVGFWPDTLHEQVGAAKVGRGENQPFWIRVKPPKGTKADVYRGKLTVLVDAKRYEIPFAVEVFNFEFPDKVTQQTAYGMDARPIFQYQKLKSDADRRLVVDKYLDQMAFAHLSPYDPTPMASPHISVSGDDVSIDWSRFDAAMEKAVNERHINAFRFNLHGLGWGNMQHRGEPDFFGHKYGSKEYDRLMSKYLGEVERHLKEKGWLEMAYIYWFDEPNPSDYEFVCRSMETIRKYAPGLRRMLTEQPEEALIGAVDLWCPTTCNFHSGSEPACRKRGDQFWWYICTEPKAPYIGLFIDHPGSELRLWSWQTWGEDIAGTLIWATTWWTNPDVYTADMKPQNPYEDAHSWSNFDKNKSSWGNGDGRFFYPPLKCFTQTGDDPILDGPVITIRLEMLREGIEDYEYFVMLKKLIAARTDLSDESRAIYEGLLKVPSSVYTSLTDFTKDPKPMEDHRVKLARAIESLKK